MTAEPRKIVLKVRLSEVELDALLSRAGGEPLASWVRSFVMNGTPPVPQRRRVYERALRPEVADLTRAVLLASNYLRTLSREIAERELSSNDRQALVSALDRVDAELRRHREASRC